MIFFLKQNFTQAYYNIVAILTNEDSKVLIISQYRD